MYSFNLAPRRTDVVPQRARELESKVNIPTSFIFKGKYGRGGVLTLIYRSLMDNWTRKGDRAFG